MNGDESTEEGMKHYMGETSVRVIVTRNAESDKRFQGGEEAGVKSAEKEAEKKKGHEATQERHSHCKKKAHSLGTECPNKGRTLLISLVD